MFQEKLIDRWASAWEQLLDNRRDLLHWKESLKAAEGNYDRTKQADYLDDIEEDEYAIRELERKISNMKARIEAKVYDPYEVLQIAHRIGQNVPFTAFDQLAPIDLAFTADCRCFHALAVNRRRTGLRLPSRFQTHLFA